MNESPTMTDKPKMSADRLAQKVRWEGGLMAALEYGIAPEQIDDPELADLWGRLQRGYREISPLLTEAMSRLDVAA
jgi:hypothetical protein